MPVNEHLMQRMAGLQSILNAVYQSNVGLSSATKGGEREAFINEFLSRVFPPTYRFGTGDVTDKFGKKSGQLDVVIEHPLAPSIPALGFGGSRLYLAECVAAVIEVKSNLSGQWLEAVSTASALSPIRPQFAGTQIGNTYRPDVPLFAVGYTGWKSHQTVLEKVKSEHSIQGALIIENGLYANKHGLVATGPFALWAFISDLHTEITRMSIAGVGLMDYVRS